MKPATKLILFSLSFFLFYSCNHKAQKVTALKIPAYVNFSLGKNTLASKKPHTITLFGCNTSVIAKGENWNGPDTFKWEASNQVLSGIPYGDQMDAKTGRPYYVSKYYIASPPVFKLDKTNTVNSNTLYDIGLVTPDEFTYTGKAPVQMVYLDYNILKPMHVDYINIKFDTSFDRLKVGYVPFRVTCDNLPWIDTKHIKNAKGGSGIGSLKKGNPHAEQLFLPYYFLNKSNNDRKYLDTQVTLLNDVLLNYKIKFIVGKDSLESINLKDFYFNPNKTDSLRVIAIKRTDIPSGCVKPISKD